MQVGPATNAVSIELPLRVTFGSGNEAVIYEYIPFQISRAGSEEEELSTVGEDVPFRLDFVRSTKTPSAGTLNFTYRFVGHDMIAVQKFMRAMRALRANRHVELYNLQTAHVLTRGLVSEDLFEEWDEGLCRLVDDAVEVSRHYGVAVRYQRLSPADQEVLHELHGLIAGDLLDTGEITLNVIKGSNTPEILKTVDQTATYRVVNPAGLTPPRVLFGTPVPTGAVFWTIEGARVVDVETAFERASSAPIGETFEVKLSGSVVQIRALGIHDNEGQLVADQGCVEPTDSGGYYSLQ